MKPQIKKCILTFLFLLPFLFVDARAVATGTPVKIILDTDPGVDDSIAIAYAVKNPAFKVLGITTIFGNTSTDQATLNAGYLLKLMNRTDIPVAKGEQTPLSQPLHSYPVFIHGVNGFGDVPVNYPSDFVPHHMSAADFIIGMVNAHPGEITLVPVGPLTNIAKALIKDPTIVGKVKEVVLMGGAANVDGNVSPAAEANVWNDPHAARIVFSAPWKVTMIGLDVTLKAIMPLTTLQRVAISEPVVGGFLEKISQVYADYYQSVLGYKGFSVHDPSALIFIAHPEYFSTKQGQVEVVQSAPGSGKTFFAPKGVGYAEDYWSIRDNAHVALTVDHDKLLEHLEATLKLPNSLVYVPRKSNLLSSLALENNFQIGSFVKANTVSSFLATSGLSYAD